MQNSNLSFQCQEIDLVYQHRAIAQDSSIWQLQCHLRIISHQFGHQTAIVSPQNCEVGWFIPSQITTLATQIVQDFQLNSDRLVWIERDPHFHDRPICSEYSEVKFEWNQGIASNPQWKSVYSEMKRDYLQ
jgi:hypothetical protein